MGFELMTSSLPRMRSTPELHRLTRAENEVRTRDPQLGRLMLYQLSYFRFLLRKKRVSRLRLGKESELSFLSACTGTPQKSHGATLCDRIRGRWWTRTTEP